MGHADGKTLFVPFSAPGDELEVEIVADRSKFSEARIVDILKPASCRVDAPCPVFGRCGGCQWQHIAYDAQLRWKASILAETLSRLGRVESPRVLDALASPQQWHYRNRMMLHVDSQGRVGYYRAGSKEVVEFEECLIAERSLNEELTARREEISKRDRGIALRTSGEESFSQVNSAQNERMKELLCEWLAEVPHESVLELYAGSGNLTERIARISRHVAAGEIDSRAVDGAAERFARLGINNVEFKRMSAEKAAKLMAHDCDVVVIDPPRKGCHDAIEAIADGGPNAIVYISCDPATLARDVAFLCERGYELEKSRPIDMFPQTFHIESISMLKKSG